MYLDKRLHTFQPYYRYLDLNIFPCTLGRVQERYMVSEMLWR
jgi:hypothetical protein